MNGKTPVRLVLAGLLMSATVAAAADAWTHHTKDKTPGLPANEVQFVGLDKAGGVWVGTVEGATHILNGAFVPLKSDKDAALKLCVWSVLEGADRTWVGHQQGVLELRNGKQTEALAGYTVASIFEIKPGVFWALGKNTGSDVSTLFEYKDNVWKAAESLAKKRLTNMYKTRNGRLWLTLDGNGVLEVDPAEGVDKAVHHLESLNVTAVMQDSKNMIWCGLWANGLAVWDGTAWKRELPKEKKSAVLAIIEDSAGGMWVSTSGSGLWRRPAGKTEWTNDLMDEGGISFMAMTADGRIWISSQSAGGLRYWDGAKWVASIESPLPISMMVETPEGSLWAGSVLDGLYVLKKGK